MKSKSHYVGLCIGWIALFLVSGFDGGCDKHSKNQSVSVVVPPIQELADKLSTYAASSEAQAHVKEITAFVAVRKSENLGDSKPVELSRTSGPGSTVVRAVWERSFTLTPDSMPAGEGAVPVVARFGNAETHMYLGIKAGDKLEKPVDFAALCNALRDPARVDAVALVQPGSFTPVDSLVHVYKLYSVEEKPVVEIAADGKSAVVRVQTRPVELEFTTKNGKLRLIACDFAQQ